MSARVFGGGVIGQWWRPWRLAATGTPTVRASRGGRGDIAKGEPVRDGWLGFKLSDTDYRRLAGAPDLSAIVTVDREAGQILGVKFLGRQSG